MAHRDQLQRQSEKLRRQMEKELKKFMDDPSYVPKPVGPLDELLKPPLDFRPPDFEHVKGSKSTAHEWSYASGTSWSQAGKRFDFRQRIGGLKVHLTGTLEGNQLKIATISVEARPGKTSSYAKLADVPEQYRDEVEAAIAEVKRRAR
jgi:hypothetical protein